MPDNDPPPIPTRAEVEAAAVRRRWITLAEILVVIGLLISGLTLLNGYQQRRADEEDKTLERQQAQEQAQNVVLRATPDDHGDRLSLASADSRQVIQSLRIHFPMALAVSPIEIFADPRIEAIWFRREILSATERDGERAAGGEQRVPVAITTRFYVGGSMMPADTAAYYLVYRVEGGGLFQGRKVRLLGLSRVGSPGTGDPAAVQNTLDALWSSAHPPVGG